MDVFRAKTAILAVAGRIKARRARPDARDVERHGKPEAATGVKQKAIPAHSSRIKSALAAGRSLAFP
ncbi:hypothetical protein ACTJLD_15560 [Burkholderia sp. 22088]|uniref:hypothetical protein n=1 Tax=Burkholderia sp. 22088 TaxID=3453871 RepID=UPI003F841B6B